MQNSNSSEEKKKKKTVRFKPTIKIKEIRHRKNMTREMVKERYLDEDDYSNIKTVIRRGEQRSTLGNSRPNLAVNDHKFA